MTNQKILDKVFEKAIAKAEANGWKGYEDPFIAPIIVATKPDWSSNAVLMDTAFAKALWGEEHTHNVAELTERATVNGHIHHAKNWEWHLMQMVVADDPIKYLGENIND